MLLHAEAAAMYDMDRNNMQVRRMGESNPTLGSCPCGLNAGLVCSCDMGRDAADSGLKRAKH
jgi:hypothetical protein